MIANTPADQVEHHPCPECEALAGSPCGTGAGKVAANYHTGRFATVPSLKAGLTVKAPADRNPGKRWVQGKPVPVVAEAMPGAAIRIGYARCSAVGPELQSQLDMLARAEGG
ncbi:hypothetical protein ABT168_09935 [Streptomyces sp. NPDC001793]|uniref:zinc finger domain-containing protein n=1 Tax=Streptomyces sp. NPDC001793 TaxID=3154657 RepID=UPI0033283A7B